MTQFLLLLAFRLVSQAPASRRRSPCQKAISTDGGAIPAFAPLAAARGVHLSSTCAELLARSARPCSTWFMAKVFLTCNYVACCCCCPQRTRAFENPFAKWLAASEELLEQPEEAAKVHKVEEDEDQHEQQPEDQPEEEEEETHYKQVDEEDERPSEGIPPPSPEHESKPQTPLAAHYERASKQQSPQDASVDDQQTHDDRRVVGSKWCACGTSLSLSSLYDCWCV